MKDVLLVFGGKSYEHDISIVTASQIFNKTRLNDVKLVPLYVSRENRYYVYTETKFDIKKFSGNDFLKSKKLFKEVVFVTGERSKLFLKTRFGLKEYLSVELAVFACHGGCAENGELVSIFKDNGIFSSSGSIEALSLCMNKYLFKKQMNGLKIPVVQGFKICKFEFENYYESLKKKFQFMKFPIIAKANNGGSSIGVFLVENRDELKEKLQQALEFDNEILIEKYIKSTREFNVSILGDREDFVVSEIDEPIKQDEILSFANKYLDSVKSKGCAKGNCTGKMQNQNRKFPADISEMLKLKIKEIAAKIFKELNLFGVVRIDFLYDELIDKLYVCEVNAMPGSLAYYFYDENRITTNYLVLKLIELAEKHKQKTYAINSEYYTNILN